MLLVHDIDEEHAEGIVAAQLGVPDAPGEVGKFRPCLKGAASEMDKAQAFAALDKPLQVGPGFLTGVRLFPVHKMQDHGVELVQLGGGQERGVFRYLHGEARVGRDILLKHRRRFAPEMTWIVDACHDEDAFLPVRCGRRRGLRRRLRAGIDGGLNDVSRVGGRLCGR